MRLAPQGAESETAMVLFPLGQSSKLWEVYIRQLTMVRELRKLRSELLLRTAGWRILHQFLLS